MRFVLLLVLGVALAIAALAGQVAWWLQRPLPLVADSAELSIEFGASAREVAQGWVDAGVRVSPRLLYEWFRWSGQARKIRAGSYEIDRAVSPRQLLQMMVRGDETLATVRLGEGWTFSRVRLELGRTEDIRQTTADQSDSQVMAALGAPGVSPEGRFYPDTYAFSRGSSDLAVLNRALQAMQRILALAWAERAPNIPLVNADEALTLASIVEKETGMPADRAMVAAVFVNRLRVGMPLQADPTVIYGLGKAFDGNLRKRDLQADTPHNTYTRTGLPPTPIALPSKASLLAAVRPGATRAMYFVARGDGSSEFSETLAAHNRAVNQYQRNSQQGK